MKKLFKIINREGPIISVALHDGHFIDEGLMEYINLEEHERFREEDPYTGFIANQATTLVTVKASRFMLDFNRSIEKSIYLKPEDAWGLNVWKKDLPENIINKLRSYYVDFYQDIEQLIKEKIDKYGFFFILDIHSYNHKRDHATETAPIEHNPEVNLGTAYNHPTWSPVLKNITGYLSNCQILNNKLDVRENIKFKGGGFAQWVCKEFGEYGGIVSIEFKKTFMEEWTGRANINHILKLQDCIKGLIPMILSDLKNTKSLDDGN